MQAQVVVARNIRRIRVMREVSQEGLAADAAVDRTYVSRLERGIENPTVGVLERLASALNCKLAEFFDEVKAGRGPVAPLRKGRKQLEKRRSK
jgi:transcriptional regulator with XRE-family HTH domain